MSLDPKALFKEIMTPLVVSLTLGLAPFLPEPHIVGKLRWVAGGGSGMALIDYGDMVMHGAPWVWLMVATVIALQRQLKPAVSAR